MTDKEQQTRESKIVQTRSQEDLFLEAQKAVLDAAVR